MDKVNPPAELEAQVTDDDTGGLDGRWFAEDGGDRNSRAETKKMLENSSIQFRLLKKILESEFRQRQIDPVDFSKPNFDQKRMYDEGYRKALQTIYKILP